MMALSQPDPALEFPSDIVLLPKIFLRNVTSSPVIADLRFNWRSQNTTGKAVGPTLRPKASRVVVPHRRIDEARQDVF